MIMWVAVGTQPICTVVVVLYSVIINADGVGVVYSEGVFVIYISFYLKFHIYKQ